ncbi:MAG TPA: ABC transporter permease [Spirochaetia bacterium]|nr:ABC transporter permease [Spirochaetia bacterium]
MMKKLLGRNETYLFLVIVVFSAIITVVNPAFLTVENLFDLLRNSSGTAILAVGFFVVLLSGGIDISFPAIAIVGQYIAVNALISLGIDNIFLALGISCLVGLAFGAVNAFFITVFKIPTLIVTLATSNLFHGALLEFVGTKAVNIGQLPNAFKSFSLLNILHLHRADGSTYGLSIFFIMLVVVVLATWFILRWTLLGRVIYAMGGDTEAVRRAGIRIGSVQFFIYCYAGLLAGVMGIIHVSLIRYSNPTYIVDSELLHVIAAVVLGGASIMGGSGTLTGTLLGVAMISILEKNLVLLGISSYWQQFFVGLVLVLGVSITHIQRRIRNRKQLAFVRE